MVCRGLGAPIGTVLTGFAYMLTTYLRYAIIITRIGHKIRISLPQGNER